MEKNEQMFYDKLKDIFIGAKIEGNSGFVNLMKIKSSYFDMVFKELKKEIDEKLKEFPDFKEEMYDKLNTFFSTYFSESGSIYFTYTPLKSKIYDKIYTDQDDVILFWKTRMLYYVKTDKIWNNLTTEYDKEGVKYKIYFDVSKLGHKSANEKREVIYQLNDKRNNEISFYVLYSERGRKTDLEEIRKELNKNKIYLDEGDLDKIFKIFERQNEVDYFINKDAKSFLREQFDLWLKNYIFDDESDFSEKRLKELKFLKDTSYKIIDFVSQFEDELVKIWNKPKFVLNSNYVITLDRIANKNGGMEIIKKILNHEKINEQIKEWNELGIIDDNFKKEEIIQRDSTESLNPKYKFLPIDTRYFKDLELDILSLFDNLDKELDGWLIHSENYQALNTILSKFKEKVQTIYIDPPFNKEQDADYFYSVKYKDATWTTMLENRIRLGKELLNERGSIFVRCDYNGNWIVRPLMDDIFDGNFINEIDVGKTPGKKKTGLSLSYTKDNLFFYAKSLEYIINETTKETYDYFFYKEILKSLKKNNFKDVNKLSDIVLNDLFWVVLDHRPGERQTSKSRKLLGIEFEPPKGRHWIKSQEKLDQLYKEGKARLQDKITGKVFYEQDEINNTSVNKNDLVIQVFLDTEIITDNWTDINGYSQANGFQTENSEILLKRVIETASNKGDLIMDFFLGSGTTTSVAHKIKRKWLGVEMGEHFYTVVLPRMKKVLAYDNSGISKEQEVKEKYNKNNAGGFFKYYDLEQYEHTLRKCHYIPSTPFFGLNDKSIYEQYVFLKDPKLLDAMELDYKNNKISIKFDEIYPNIDIAETLSNLKGKWIKKIAKNSVILVDNNGDEEEIKYDSIDFKTIKPLIWW